MHNASNLGTCRQMAWAPVATPLVMRKAADARRLPTRSGSAVVAAQRFNRAFLPSELKALSALSDFIG